MARTDFRSRHDAELERQLLEDTVVKRQVEASAKDQLGTRRRLLSTSLRVSRGMSRRLDEVLGRCVDALGVETAVETYVFPDAAFNAACARPEDQRVFLLLSSGLLEAFDDDELAFVVGHELGHHLFDHHKFPLHALLEHAQPPTGPLAMMVFAWSRYAEVSADRAGLLCSSGFEAAAKSFFKLASGLKGGLVEMKPDALLQQLGDFREELGREPSSDEKPKADWFATHPFSPLRLRAARSFVGSQLFGKKDGIGLEVLEAEVSEAMSLMEPTYLQEKSEPAELMRRVLLAGGVLVAHAAGGMSDTELAALEKFFGKGSISSLNPEALRRDLPRRLSDAKERVTPLKRAQVLRDVCIVALADGHADAKEVALLKEMAEGLNVGAELVDATLSGPRRLD
jgi:tellurite resistance protein